MRVVLKNDRVCFKCPNCEKYHLIPAERWHFNGDVNLPTLTPSVKEYYEPNELGLEYICHFFLTNGIIDFCGDCTHKKVVGKIPLPELMEEEVETIMKYY